MGADGKLQLEEKLIDRAADIAVVDAAKLPAKLAEFRRPERQCRRNSSVRECSCAAVAGHGAIGGVDAKAGEPALRDLTISRRVKASELAVDVGAIVADQLEPSDE